MDKLSIEARSILSGWEALGIAVNNSFGGVKSREKAEWLKNETIKYIVHHQSLTEDDVEYFLSTIMDQEFNTIIEDGSLSEISKQLCDLWKARHYIPSQKAQWDVTKRPVTQSDGTSDHVTKNDCVADHVTENDCVADHVTKSDCVADHVTKSDYVADHVTKSNCVADHVTTTSDDNDDSWTEVIRRNCK